MKQIKTIKTRIETPEEFDQTVNDAIAEGWELTKRYTIPSFFIAEMEGNVITEDERVCENCLHRYKHLDEEPCQSCGDDASKWEPQV